MTRHIPLALSALLLLGGLVPSLALAADPVPAETPDGWIADGAGMLDAGEEARTREFLAHAWNATRVRLAVLTVADARGQEPKAMAVRALNQWGAGRRSALLLAVANPRKLYLQPGTDLKEALDEPHASAICHDAVAPLMRQQKYGDALRAGLRETVRRIGEWEGLKQGATAGVRGDPGEEPASGPALPPDEEPAPTGGTGPTGGSKTGLGWLALGGGVTALVATTALARSRRRRSCPKCGSRMTARRNVIDRASLLRAGRGETEYSCACGNHFSEAFLIPMLSGVSSSSSSHSSSSDSSSSWSSSGSSSDSSSSSSSSDGGGGGGSDY